MSKIAFAEFTPEEFESVKTILGRAEALAGPEVSPRFRMELMMDLSAAHSDCPLDLAGLASAGDGDFGHDVFGIQRYLNRKTGELGDCFVPRLALPEEVKAP